ncbi:hypothetical protein GPA10_27680 [Streptomyces sp. p1417]|uniref:Uncharacterized protein n=1 Tax=Streptomyces typhae TaxID=2681492 RepID=A0A6L6X498_9ACTN|nr:hypothetical protein [Streptomyces typhae]MVO88440.1 hypothetical protein [Streptomyces typhae]
MTDHTTPAPETVPEAAPESGPQAAPAPDSTESLQQQLVQSLMGIIGAPDDAETARAADTVLRALDARLAGRAAAA